MFRILIYLSAREITGSLFRFFSLYRALRRWGRDWEAVVRTPLPSPWPSSPGLQWERIPLPEPSPRLGGDRVEEWIGEWLRGWPLWLEGESKVVEGLSPRLIISDMAPQPLLLAKEMGIPGWFIGHFNWYSYLAQFMEVSGLLDEVALAYEAAQVAFVPPFSWGQGIFSLLQEVPVIGGEVVGDRVREVRKKALARGTPVFVGEGLEARDLGIRETWGNPVILTSLDHLPAAQVAYLRPSYSHLVTALRGEVPCVLYPHGEEPSRSMALEMEGLGVAVVRDGTEDKPSSQEMAHLVNTAYEAYRALPSLYRLDGSQFLIESVTQLEF